MGLIGTNQHNTKITIFKYYKIQCTSKHESWTSPLSTLFDRSLLDFIIT